MVHAVMYRNREDTYLREMSRQSYKISHDISIPEETEDSTLLFISRMISVSSPRTFATSNVFAELIIFSQNKVPILKRRRPTNYNNLLFWQAIG